MEAERDIQRPLKNISVLETYSEDRNSELRSIRTPCLLPSGFKERSLCLWERKDALGDSSLGILLFHSWGRVGSGR